MKLSSVFGNVSGFEAAQQTSLQATGKSTLKDYTVNHKHDGSHQTRLNDRISMDNLPT